MDYTDKRRNKEQFLMRKNHAYIELPVFYCELSLIDRLWRQLKHFVHALFYSLSVEL